MNTPGCVYTMKTIQKRRVRLAESGWPPSKWLLFCEEMLKLGLDVTVVEARTTLSKYVYVVKGDRAFKVRFSNHKPNRYTQAISDSDFYVGVSHGLVTRTEDAIAAARRFFGSCGTIAE